MLYPLQLFWDYDMIRLICGKWTKIVKLSKKKGRHDNVLILASDSTGKSLSEALISASTNLQYDDRLFIELQVQYMKIPSSNLGRTCCVQKMFLTFRTIFVHNMFSPCPAKRRDSDKDLPVLTIYTSNVFTSYTAATTLKNSHNFVAIIVNTAECKSHARFPHSLGFRQSQLCMNWSVILQTLNIMTLSKEKLTSLV